MKSRISPDPRTGFKTSVFPAHLEEESYRRHEALSISMESSPLVLYPRKRSRKS